MLGEVASDHVHDPRQLIVGLARLIFQTMLEDGLTWARPGWTPEYACLTNADYVALFHDGIYKHAKEEGHF